jgi:hypothetical protein
MNRLALAALALAALAAPALAEVTVGAVLGTDEPAIRAALVADGYDVRKVESEDGALEVYALKDGKKLEIHITAKTGVVERVKEED